MRSTFTRTVTAAVGFAAVTAVSACRGDRPPSAVRARPDAAPAVTAVTARPADTVRATAMQQLVAVAHASRDLMPEPFGTVYIGMTLDQLRHARPTVVHGRSTADGRSDVWEETTEGGTRVVYLVVPGLGIVSQVQFMSRLPDADALLANFRALRTRYGEPTGFWDCPETETVSAIRRVTWRRDAASVTQAILMYPRGVSVTLVVSATADTAAALRRSQCQPVTAASLAQWPIASVLRGEEAPFAGGH